MAFNGSGTFSRLFSWVADRNNGIAIQAGRMDAELDGIAAGLSQCITKDGQTLITGDINLNGNRIINAGAPVAGSDFVSRDSADARYVRNPNDLPVEPGIDNADLLPFYDSASATNRAITYANFKSDLVTEGIAGVASFNTRQGAVVSVAGDYTATQVTNNSGVAGATVAAALDTLNVAVGANAGSSYIFNHRNFR